SAPHSASLQSSLLPPKPVVTEERPHLTGGVNAVACRPNPPFRKWLAALNELPPNGPRLSCGAPLSARARRSLPLRRRSTPSARRRRATWHLRRGSPCR